MQHAIWKRGATCPGRGRGSPRWFLQTRACVYVHAHIGGSQIRHKVVTPGLGVNNNHPSRFCVVWECSPVCCTAPVLLRLSSRGQVLPSAYQAAPSLADGVFSTFLTANKHVS